MTSVKFCMDSVDELVSYCAVKRKSMTMIIVCLISDWWNRLYWEENKRYIRVKSKQKAYQLNGADCFFFWSIQNDWIFPLVLIYIHRFINIEHTKYKCVSYRGSLEYREYTCTNLDNINLSISWGWENICIWIL